MNKQAKREDDYLIWIESDDFYQDDKWSLTKHKYYKELSKMYNLYRQDYCGCVFSMREKTLKE